VAFGETCREASCGLEPTESPDFTRLWVLEPPAHDADHSGWGVAPRGS